MPAEGDTGGDVETGTPTVWDNAWREGFAHALEQALSIPYHEAFSRTVMMLQGQPLDTSRPGDCSPGVR